MGLNRKYWVTYRDSVDSIGHFRGLSRKKRMDERNDKKLVIEFSRQWREFYLHQYLNSHSHITPTIILSQVRNPVHLFLPSATPKSDPFYALHRKRENQVSSTWFSTISKVSFLRFDLIPLMNRLQICCTVMITSIWLIMKLTSTPFTFQF